MIPRIAGEPIESHARRKASERATRYLIVAPRGQAMWWRRCEGLGSLIAIRAVRGRTDWCLRRSRFFQAIHR